LREFFSEKVEFGRYASKSVGEIFTCDRRYFDQILHRNASFRNRYAKAYGDWSLKLEKAGADTEGIRRERVIEAVAIIGDGNVQKLFDGMIEFIIREYPSGFLSDKISFKETLTNAPPCELKDHLKTVTKFWARLALPEA